MLGVLANLPGTQVGFIELGLRKQQLSSDIWGHMDLSCSSKFNSSWKSSPDLEIYCPIFLTMKTDPGVELAQPNYPALSRF